MTPLLLRSVALVLLLLAASPVTAPFATLDLDPGTATAPDPQVKSKLAHKDITAVPAAFDAPLPPAGDPARRIPRALPPAAIRPPLSLVLRI